MDFNLKLDGLTCNSCISSLSQKLNLLGIKNPKISLTNAQVTVNNQNINIISEIEELGFMAEIINLKVKVSIKGMTCNSCIKAIKQAFKNKNTIVTVLEINLKEEFGIFEILYSDGFAEITVDEVLEIIEDCGFDACIYTLDTNNSTDIQDTSDSRPITPPKKPSLIPKSSGFSTVTISITGMTCASCVNSIEEYVSGKDGISKCQVSLAMETAVVEFDESKLKPQKIVEMVDDLGFEGKVDGKLSCRTTKVHIVLYHSST